MSTVMELNMQLILELSTHTKVHFWSNKATLDNDSPVSSELKSLKRRKKLTRLDIRITVHALL